MLRKYQKDAANFLWTHPRAALFLGCGYGKTLICLAVMDLLIKRALVKTIVLIAPPAVLKTTWQDEAKKWGYEQVIPHIHFVSNCNTKTLYAEYDLMIVDELSAFKDTGTNRFRITKKTKCKRFIGLTGTPVGNGLADLYGQMKLIIPAWYNKNQFMYTYFTPALQNGYIVYKWAPRPNAEVNIFENIKDYCFRIDATIELPEISYQVDNVVLPSNMLAKYKKFKQDLLLELKTDTITAANGAVLTNKLLQFCSGAMVTDKGYEFLHSKKTEALEKLLYEPSAIFYAYKHEKEAIALLLGKTKRTFTYDDYEGWNQGKYDHIILHPKAAGYGLNLQGGGRLIIWYTMTWSLEQYMQANARLYRSGQKNNVIVKHLITSGTDESKVYRAIQAKEKTLDLFLSLFDK